MCDLTGKFTGETEVSAGHLDPTPNALFRRNSMKSRIHFNCREIVGIKFQPVTLWQIRRVKRRASLQSSMRTSRCVSSADRSDSKRDCNVSQSSVLGKGFTFGKLGQYSTRATVASKT